MLVHEAWFTLELESKYVVREYMGPVLSTLIYGTELYREESMKPFQYIEVKMLKLFPKKLLKLCSGPLAK